MDKETNMTDVITEVQNANEEELKEVIEKWFEQTRTQGMKIGARYISAAIFGVIQKHTRKAAKVSLRDYERMTNDIMKIISVQLTKQNDSEENNDRTTE